jgi:hypothetical protein
VAFGNPALGTYNGSIVTVHSRKVEQQHSRVEDCTSEDDESSCSSFSSCSSLNSLLQEDYDCGDESKGHKKANRTAVMTNVPPHQVPDGKIVAVSILPLNC